MVGGPSVVAATRAGDAWSAWTVHAFRRVLLATLGLSCPLLVVAALAAWRQAGVVSTASAVVVLSAITLVALWLLRTPRKAQLAIRLFIGGLIGLCASLMSTSGAAPALAVGLTVAVLLGGVFLGPRAVWWLTLLTTSVFFVAAVAYHFGWIHPIDPAVSFDWSSPLVWTRIALSYATATMIAAANVSMLVHRLKEGLREREEAVEKLIEEEAHRRAEEDKRAMAERALAQAQKVEVVGRLAAGLAHDFNNLLLVIRASAEFTRDMLEPDHPAREDSEAIIEAATRGAVLTRQLLGLTRQPVAAGDRVEASEVVRHLSSLLPRLLGHDIQLETELGSNLAPIAGSAAQLEQVLLNLAINARDAMPVGGRLRIAARSSVTPDGLPAVAFEVSDTGTGMSEAVRAHLFEPFFTTKPVGLGTGLGLTTSQTIVAQLGGHIAVESALQQGTTFRVVLPALPEATPASRPRPEPARAKTAEVLVLDEEPVVRAVIVRALSGHGHRVVEAASADEAIRRVTESPPDVVVMDLKLEREDGLQVVDRLQAARPSLGIVLTSGFTRDDAALQSRLDGGVLLVAKPFRPEELAAAVARAAPPLGTQVPRAP